MLSGGIWLTQFFWVQPRTHLCSIRYCWISIFQANTDIYNITKINWNNLKPWDSIELLKQWIFIYHIQCLIFHCRPLSRRSPTRPASRLLRVSVPGAFLRPVGGSCRVENLNSSVYVYHANLQSENCETPISCGNLLRDFLGLRSNVCPISSRFPSVSTWRVLWGFLSRTEQVFRNLFTSLRTVSLWGAWISGNLSLNSRVTSLQDPVRT